MPWPMIASSRWLPFWKTSAIAVALLPDAVGLRLICASGVAVAGASGPVAYTARIHNDGNIARIGVNYKFGTPAAPVVARY